MIYLDNAATTLQKPPEVYDAVIDAMKHHGNPGRGACEASLVASRAIYGARDALTQFFGGSDPSRLIFTANATDSLNAIIRGIFRPGDHVITTQLEHNSVLRPLYDLEEYGVKVTVVGCCAGGTLAIDEVRAAVTPHTKAVVCTHASNVTGNTVDLEILGALAHAHGLLFIVDASQTAGILPVDAARMQIDVLAFTGHKGLMGPQGTGGYYVREGVEIRPTRSGGTGVHSFLRHQPQELPERLEAGTRNSHGIAGLLAGVRVIQHIGLSDIYEKEHRLMVHFIEQLKDVAGVVFYGDYAPQGRVVQGYEQIVRAPIVALNVRGNDGYIDAGELSDWLMQEYGIATRAGAHCAPLMHQYFGTEKQGMVRFSFSYYNTMEEVDEAAAAVREIACDVW